MAAERAAAKTRRSAEKTGTAVGPSEAGVPETALLQLQRTAGNQAIAGLLARQPNNTGLPDTLKAGIEHLSGVDMDAVRVHYNSGAPGGLSAMAYAQGTDIHLGPGQEQLLPHEAWHVAQQAQGRVQATQQFFGKAGSDDRLLEEEADRQGALAASIRPAAERPPLLVAAASPGQTVQRVKGTLAKGTDGKWRITGGSPTPTAYVIANSARLDSLVEAKAIKAEGEEREFAADSPMKGYARITYSESDNQAYEKLSEQTKEEAPKSDQLIVKFAGLEKDGGKLVAGGSYPEAKECDDLVKANGGWKYDSQLPIVVLMHYNAKTIVQIIGAAPKDEQLEYLYALGKVALQWGSGGGTLIENNEKYVGNLDALETYLKVGYDSMKELWTGLASEEQKLDFAHKVMDSQKGYSWVQPEAESFTMAKLLGGDSARGAEDILSDWLATGSNLNPFSGENVHVDKLGDLLKKEYAGYDAKTQGNVHGAIYSQLMNKSGSNPKKMGDFIKKQRDGIVKALTKHVGAELADAITKGVEQAAKDFSSSTE